MAPHLSAFGCHLPRWGRLLVCLTVYLFFLTSTAFVSTNAKYGIPLSRYTVFYKTVLKSTDLYDTTFFYSIPPLDFYFLLLYNKT